MSKNQSITKCMSAHLNVLSIQITKKGRNTERKQQNRQRQEGEKLRSEVGMNKAERMTRSSSCRKGM